MTDAPLTALVLLFEGFEEIEAFTPVDLLSRAGITVTLANIDSGESVTGRSGITVQTTQSFETLAAQKFDCLILPGGPGIAKLRKHPLLCETLREYHQSKRILGCICAAPLLLLDAVILPGPAYTCHPAAEDELSDASQQAVIQDQHCITARGAGTALAFSLALIQHLVDNETAQTIAQAICAPEHPDL
jgi:4-methyl-5(b-hydroxyethyl)-thiazole monophosphate biosynthesis